MRSASIAAALLASIIASGAAAQTGAGFARTFSAGTLPLDLGTCTSIGPTTPIFCNVTVKVKTVNNWGRRCDLKVTPEVILVKGVPNSWSRIRLVWTLDAPTGSDYSFDPSLGIAIAEGLAPDVYNEPTESTSLPVSTMTVTYRKASLKAHNYNVHVMRKSTTGAWVACGVVDPLIVNTD